MTISNNGWKRYSRQNLVGVNFLNSQQRPTLPEHPQLGPVEQLAQQAAQQRVSSSSFTASSFSPILKMLIDLLIDLTVTRRRRRAVALCRWGHCMGMTRSTVDKNI